MSHSIGQEADKWYDLPSKWFNHGFKKFRNTVFKSFMHWVLVFRYPVLALVGLLLATQVALFFNGDVKWRFFNAPERGSISANIAMLPGADRRDTLEMVRELQRTVQVTAQEYEDKYGVYFRESEHFFERFKEINNQEHGKDLYNKNKLYSGPIYCETKGAPK